MTKDFRRARDVLDRAMKGETVAVFPGRGTNAALIAFNPKTGLVYLNSWNQALMSVWLRGKST